MHGMPLAIVGMACRFPGADNLDEFWQMLLDGGSGIAPLPQERLDRQLNFDPQKGVPGKTYCQVGGVVPWRDVDRMICPVSEDILARYDVAHQTLCEVAAAAYHHAGYELGESLGGNTGIYIGNSSGGSDLVYRTAYHVYAREMAERLLGVASFSGLAEEEQRLILNDVVESIRSEFPNRESCPIADFAPHAAAGILAEAFRTTGPAVVVDAACASSFVALDLAANAIAQGVVDSAIVGAAACRKFYEWVAIAQAQSMTTRGVTCPFDADADGLISSDGYGVVLVKSLERAQADNDQILGVVRGIGVSSDGRGKGFWAPRQEGQVAAIRRAYSGGLDPSRLQYLEAHATSTQLGDATEMASLTEAIGSRLTSPVPVGSVKANIGHTLESAGIAGLIKTLLAMQHGIVPPAANVKTPNPTIDWANVPFSLPLTAVEWPVPVDGHSRRAAVDSFGIGGLNVHVVVDQHAEASAARTGAPVPDAIQTVSSSPEARNEPIAVIGMGCVLPGATTVEEFWQLLASGRDPKQPVPNERWNAECALDSIRQTDESDRPLRGGFVTSYEFDWRRFRVPPKQVAGGNPLHFMLIDATQQALDGAGYGALEFDRNRVATIVGAVFQNDFIVDAWQGSWLPDLIERVSQVLRSHGKPESSIEQIAGNLKDAVLQAKPAALDDSGSISSSTLASRIAKQFDLMGGATSTDSGDLSSLSAISAAVNQLRAGQSDMVICAAAERRMDRTAYEELALQHVLAHNEARPIFDEGFDGILPAEGACVLLLKRLSDAKRDGDPIRGIIRSVGEATDANSTSAALASAAQQSFQTAGTDPSALRMIETASCGSGDVKAYSEALCGIVANTSRSAPVLIGTSSAQFGDLGGCAGMMSAIKVILALEQARLPATFGLQSPADVFNNSSSQLAPLTQSPDEQTIADVATGLTAVSALWSFGGTARGGSAAFMLIEGSRRWVQQPPNEQAARERGLSQRVSMDSTDTPDAGPPEPTAVEFDATQKRKARLKQQALAKQAAANKAADADASPPKTPPSTPVEQPAQAVSQPQPAMQAETSAQRRESRFIRRIVPQSLPAGSSKVPTFHGPALIVGHNKVADALRDRLVQLGTSVYQLSPFDDVDAALNEFGLIWQQSPIPHLFVLTGHDEAAAFKPGDVAAWQKRCCSGLLIPIAISRKWLECLVAHDLVETASLTSLTALGGDFGLSGRSDAIEGIGVATAIESLHQQTGVKLKTRIIDTPSREPVKMIVAEILGELAQSGGDVRSGYMRGRRHVFCSCKQPPPAFASQAIAADGVWVIVSDNAEISAHLSQGIQQSWQARVHVLDPWSTSSPASTSSRPTAAESVALTIEEIRKSDGPIQGLVFGLPQHHQASGGTPLFHEELSPAIEGVECLQTLMALTEHDPLKCFATFAAASGSQTNADDVAEALIGPLTAGFGSRHPQCAAFSIRCDADSSRPSCDPERFAAHLLDAIRDGSIDYVIDVRDPSTQATTESGSAADVNDRQTRLAQVPVVNDVQMASLNTGVAWATFDPASDPFLTSHQDEGTPLFPAVIGIEMCAEAAYAAFGGRHIASLFDFKLLNGLRMNVDTIYRTCLEFSVEGTDISCNLFGDYFDKNGDLADPLRQYQSSRMTIRDSIEAVPVEPFGAPPAEWRDIDYPDDWRARVDNRAGTVFYGPALRSLKAVSYNDDGSAWGRYVAPYLTDLNGRRAGQNWCTASALLDAVLVSCDLYAAHQFGTRQFPHAIEALHFGRMPRAGETCYSRLFYRGSEERHYVFTFVVVGEDGTLLFSSDGCRFVNVDYSAQK